MQTIFSALLLLVLFFATLTGCAQNPVTHEQQLLMMSEEDEVLLGEEADLKIKDFFGVYNNPQLTAYVDHVGQKIVDVTERKNITYHFTILDTNIVNAFALPGGYVYITRGLLSRLNSESELANVLAHELTHITARHGVQRISQQYSYQLGWISAGILLRQHSINQWRDVVDFGTQVIMLGYSREHEFEADTLGTAYAERAGYDPAGMYTFLETLEREEEDHPEFLNWLETHPPTQERIEKAKRTSEKIRIQDKKYAVLKDSFKERIKGLEIGANNKLGVINGRQYKNQYYGCKIVVPKNWELRSGLNNALLLANDQEKKYSTYLQAVQLDKKLTAKELAEHIEEGLGQSLEKYKELISSSSYTAYYKEEVKDIGTVIERRDYITRDHFGYAITYLAREKDFLEGEIFFQQIQASFELLASEEMNKSYSQYLVIYTVQENDTPQSIAKKKLLSENKFKELLAYNGLTKDARLYCGQKLKLPPKGY